VGRVAETVTEPNSIRLSHMALLLVRAALALLFLYAGAMKILHTQEFAFDVQSYQLTNWTVSILIAVYLPWLEVCAAAAILAKKLYLGALALIGLMAALFLGAISSAWWRGLDITCGCFGPEINRTNYPLHIAIDLALLGAAALLFVLELRRTARQSGNTLP
jgi:putative oxidoreductase